MQKCAVLKTGGIFLSSNDNIASNQLMDAFASLTLSTGDYTKEPVQVCQVIPQYMYYSESAINIMSILTIFIFITPLARECWSKII